MTAALPTVIGDGSGYADCRRRSGSLRARPEAVQPELATALEEET
jgi:hypothetical protein